MPLRPNQQAFQALQNCKLVRNPIVASQEHYGKSDRESVAAVKEVYNQLGLEQKFFDYEQQSHDRLMTEIQQQSALPAAVFTLLLNKIYKRKK